MSQPATTGKDLTPLLDRAKAHTLSYASAMALSHQPTTTRQTCAAALASHYLPAHTAFALGSVHRMLPDPLPSDPIAAIAGMIESHLERFEKAGFGWKISMVESEMEVVPLSEGSAGCWVTWEIVTDEGVQGGGWQWRNLYGYRWLEQEGKGGWEYSVSDNEIGEVMRRTGGKFMEL